MTDPTTTTDLTEQTASVVAVGGFNPRIFHPTWLLANGVIGQGEADRCIETGIELIHTEIAILQLSQLRLEVSLDRIQINALEAPLVKAKDFAVNIFSLLPHSPVREVGLNFVSAFRARRVEDWHALGDALAPKGPWSALAGVGAERPVGLHTLVMERSPREDGRPGYKRVHISAKDRTKFITEVGVNDHYNLDAAGNAQAAAELIEERWAASAAEADNIVLSMRALTHAS